MGVEDVTNLDKQLTSIPLTITASVSDVLPNTKTSYTSEGGFTWAADDQIAVYYSGVVETNNVQGWLAYQVSERQDENKTATFTLVASETAKAADFESKGLTATGVAVYPVVSARPAAENGSTMTIPYSQDIPIVKMQPSASTTISEVSLTGVYDKGMYNFSTAGAVLKVTVSNVHKNATSISLVTDDKEHYPVAGDFILSPTGGIYAYTFGTGGTYKYYSDFPYKLTVPVSPASDGASFTCYFNVPVGTYDENKLSIKIQEEDGENIRVYSKAIKKPVTTRANELLSLPELSMTYPTYSVAISSDANTPKLKHTTNYMKFCVTSSPTNDYSKYSSGQKYTNAETNNEYALKGNATYYEDSTNKTSLTTSGKYYLHFVLKDVSGDSNTPTSLDDIRVVEYGTIPFYFIKDSDKDLVVAQYRWNSSATYSSGNNPSSNPAALMTDNNYNTITIAVGDDANKGNVMITEFAGLHYNPSTVANTATTLITSNWTTDYQSTNFQDGSPLYGNLGGVTLSGSTIAAQFNNVMSNVFFRDNSSERNYFISASDRDYLRIAFDSTGYTTDGKHDLVIWEPNVRLCHSGDRGYYMLQFNKFVADKVE